MDTQVSYIIPMVFNLIDPPAKDMDTANLVNTIKRINNTADGRTFPLYSLITGFIGTSWINKALSDHGETETAYRLLQQTSYPFWLYSVDQGRNHDLGTFKFLYPY
jgi:alpha-L-rhamnosidase